MRSIVFVFLFFPALAFSSDPTPEFVKSELEKAEKEFQAELQSEDKASGERELLPLLAKKVEELNNRLSVDSALSAVTQAPKNIRVYGAVTVFNYKPTAIYQIFSAPNYVTDIQLRPGETITSPPTSGDTLRWNMAVMKSGSGEKEQIHIIIKPLDENIETNLIVSTNERIYQIRLKSQTWHMPAVSWNYPQEEEALKQEFLSQKKREEPVFLSTLCFDYKIRGEKKSFAPLRVFDDGKKTYIQMPKELSQREAPVLFIKDGSEEILVNYRVKGDYYILDRLFEKALLRIGSDSEITIVREGTESLFELLF